MLFLRLCFLNEALTDVKATVGHAEREVIGIQGGYWQWTHMGIPEGFLFSYSYLFPR